LGVKPNAEDRISRSERLDQATFELMNFRKVEAGRLCRIYPRDQLRPLPNVEQTALLQRTNLHWVPGNAAVVGLASPPPPFTFQAGLSSSSQPTYTDSAEVQVTLRSIQEEQMSIRAYVAFENVPLHDFVQERHDELCGMLATQTQYFQDFRANLETWRD